MKILILENDAELDMDLPFARYVKKLKTRGHELRYVFNAYGNREEIIKQINWPDVVAFTTTFVYIHPIYELAQAIAKYRKAPMEMWIMADNVEGAIDWMIDKYASYPVYEGPDKRGPQWEYTWHIDQDKAEQFGYMFRHIDIKRLPFSVHDTNEKAVSVRTLFALGSKWQVKMETDKSFLESRNLDNPQALTGRMIRICEGLLKSAPGPKWANLKPGMIVPEISMLGASERVAGKMVDRGAWVMGVGEPVKVLNSEGHDEFEYVVRSYDELALDILKMCGKELSPKNFFYVSGVLKDEELAPHWKATEILDEFGVPRRGYRDRMERKIAEFLDSTKAPA